MTSYERKHQLYRDYFKELIGYSDNINDKLYEQIDRLADNNFAMYITASSTKWINISEGASDEDIFSGFVIIGKSYPNLYRGTDYSICEAYVDKKYRGNKYCRSVVKDYVARHPGKWSMAVSRKHPYAETYWDDLFVNDLGYKKRYLNGNNTTSDSAVRYHVNIICYENK